MATVEEIREWKKQGKNREIIAAVQSEEVSRNTKNDEKLLEKAWAHHQLGEYDESLPIMSALAEYYSPLNEIGESALRGYAHGILQRDSDIHTADDVMKRIPLSMARDNVRINMMIMAVRKGLAIPAEEIMFMITNALQSVPYATVNGHIVNNGALVLHEARQQEAIKLYLSILPGLMDTAIGIYKFTKSPENHIAGAEFRAAQICRANGWLKLAKLSAEESVALWRDLVNSQDGERYQKNLEGARELLKDLEWDTMGMV